MRRLSVLLLALASLFALQARRSLAEETPNALQQFVDADEEVFKWSHLGSVETDAGATHRLHLVSQTWQGIVWEHALQVYEPAQLDHPEHMLLFVTGGRNGRNPDAGDAAMGLQLAQLCGARVAVLHQVPNQPLLGDHYEDDLITETWLKYLETGDASWPLLFPMVKSAVKAMDALEEFSEEKWNQKVDGFVITGASKRGWTSWLTPVADKRVIGTAPIVIDVLNFRAQMKHQLETWGTFSEQINDYTRKGLVKRPGETESPREIQLRVLMDPFSYREQVTIPKLLIVGTNDRYWVVDAMNLYFDDLTGPRYIRQVPNAGHSLKGGREGAMASLGVFFRHVVSGKKLPEIKWNFSNSDEQLSLKIESETTPRTVRLWTATSDTKDFRDAKWTSQPMAGFEGERVATVERPESGHIAVFGEVEFELNGLPWSLTTLVYRR